MWSSVIYVLHEILLVRLKQVELGWWACRMHERGGGQ
jgi:hypothetical protein